MTYEIFEGNMERLEKKLNHIANKCNKFGCDFHYKIVGDTLKEVEDDNGKKHMARFILVEAEGTAIMNNWEFVASVEHTENGNIITGPQNIEVPSRYYVSSPICEHCKSNRYRKYTYIVRNKETGEFKQVGRSCLKDFTHGLSAEVVTQYMSLFDHLIQGRTPEPGSSTEYYLSKEEYMAYAAETIRHFGYIKAGSDEISTMRRSMLYYEAVRGEGDPDLREALMEEMDEIGFNVHRPETVKLVKDALMWIAGQPENNNYIHNLKTACSLDYMAYKNAGLLASLFPTYTRAMEREAKYRTDHVDESNSKHVGAIDDTVTFDVHSLRCMSSFETQYGTKRIYKFVDTKGNVYIWKTGLSINNESAVKSVTGIVKGHTEFRGIKQTELQRCKMTT